MKYEYKNILIALDGSKLSEEALAKSVQIAKRNNALLFLAHVVDTKSFTIIEPYDSAIYERSEAIAEKMLANYESTVKEAGLLNVERIVKLGSPKAIITEEIIPDKNIDLVILGATGQGAVERILMGSVSENVVRNAECDVLVVR